MAVTINGTTGITTPDITTDSATVDTTTLVVDETNNRVGVGTDSPSATFHVEGGSNNQMRVSSTGAEANLTLDGGSYAQINNTTGTLYVTNNTASDIEMRTASTTRLKVDGSGRVTMPYQPSFLTYLSGGNVYATAIGSSATDAFPFNSTQHNTGNHYSTSTHQFTAPVDGVYAFSVHFRVDQANTYVHGCIVVNNGFALGGLTMRMISNVGPTTFQETTASATIQLSANDTVHVVSDDGSLTGASTTFQNGQCWFSGTLLG